MKIGERNGLKKILVVLLFMLLLFGSKVLPEVFSKGDTKRILFDEVLAIITVGLFFASFFTVLYLFYEKYYLPKRRLKVLKKIKVRFNGNILNENQVKFFYKSNTIIAEYNYNLFNQHEKISFYLHPPMFSNEMIKYLEFKRKVSALEPLHLFDLYYKFGWDRELKKVTENLERTLIKDFYNFKFNLNNK